jgi:L-aspartate oxidase
MSNTIEHRCDLLVIGSGAAGLSLALKMAEHCNVIVLSKSDINEGSTRYAQGGIAAVFDDDDSIENHIADTINAGAGICEENVVRFTAENAKRSMQWLIGRGVPFDQEKDENGNVRFHLTREGGHSHRRILHAADATGEAVQSTLSENVKHHPNIHLFERYNAIDLIKKIKRIIAVSALTSGIVKKSGSRLSVAASSLWLQAAQVKFINIPLTLMFQVETVSLWHGERDVK